MRRNDLFNILAIGPIVLGPVAAQTAHAEIYMSEEQAAQSIFPNLTFQKMQLQLNPTEVDEVEKACGEAVRSPQLKIYKAPNNDLVFIDQVLGKHEFITYAVGIENTGKVRGIEILEYRETYGSQVRSEDWTKQFVGKTSLSPLKLDKDIKGISGATLSSAHVTGGVRRLLHTYEQIKAQL